MGSLYSYCDIKTKLVYPRELSRISGFCTDYIKIFREKVEAGNHRSPLSSRIVLDCITAPTSLKFNSSFLLVNELKAFWKLSVQIFASDCFQNFENSRDGEILNARSFESFESFELSKFRKQILDI